MVAFEWDQHTLRKIRVHCITPEEVEQALVKTPIPIYERGSKVSCAPPATPKPARPGLLAAIVTERAGKIRVMTAYG